MRIILHQSSRGDVFVCKTDWRWMGKWGEAMIYSRQSSAQVLER